MSDMSRKEAIAILKNERDNDIFSGCGGRKDIHEALSIAILSLETDEAYQMQYEKPEFGEDCVPRKVVERIINSPRSQEQMLTVLNNTPSVIPVAEDSDDYVSRKAVKKILQYIHISIEKGYGFDYEKWLDRVEDLARVIPKAEDVVSREEVFKIMDDIETAVHEGDGFQYSEWCGQVYMLPNVMPKAKKGHWIGHREHCENLGVMPSGLGAYEWCSNCDCGIDVREWHKNHYNYCPKCGSYNGGDDNGNE